MIRLFTYIIVSLSTFTIGVSSVRVYSLLQAPQVELTQPDESALAIIAKPKKRFNPTFRGCKPGWVQGYETPEGHRLSESGYEYSTHKQAEREMRKRIRGAEEIIERGPQFDGQGKRVGERVVIVYPADSAGKKWAGIIWREGTIIRTIYAPSLELAMEFEESPHDPY